MLWRGIVSGFAANLVLNVLSTIIVQADGVIIEESQSFYQVWTFNPEENYGRLSVSKFVVPPGSNFTEFRFAVVAQSRDCPDRIVHISLQYGGFPLLNNLTSSTQASLIAERGPFTGGISVKVEFGTTTSVRFPILRPPYGLWYSLISLRPLDEDKHIALQDFKKTCNYGVSNSEALSLPYKHDITDLLPNVISSFTVTIQPKVFKFKVPTTTHTLRVSITDCILHDFGAEFSADNDSSIIPDPLANSSLPNNTSCDFLASIRALSIPLPLGMSHNASDTGQIDVDCSQNERNKSEDNATTSAGCVLEMVSPPTEQFIYLRIAPEPGVNVSFSLLISTDDCLLSGRTPAMTRFIVDRGVYSVYGSRPFYGHPSVVCYMYPPLNQRLFSGQFTTAFYHIILQGDMYLALENTVSVLTLNSDNLSVGRTLALKTRALSGAKISITGQDQNSSNITADAYSVISLCIQPFQLPVNGSHLKCITEEHSVTINNSHSRPGTTLNRYIPYPRVGRYYVAFSRRCYLYEDNSQIKCPNQTADLINIRLSISPCLNGGCGKFGACKTKLSHIAVPLFYCSCSGGYRGFDCSDNRFVIANGIQLLQTLLLTLSNLMFIPAILVALRRKHWCAALTYAFTMFSSGFYHLCDGDRVYKYCIGDYNVLQFSDFLGSYSSFWVTFVTMSTVPTAAKGVLFLFGIFGLAISVRDNARSSLVFLSFCGLGMVLVIVSWVYTGVKSKKCYPKKRHYLFFVPGILFSVTGLVLYAFVETDSNYDYVHSVWHCTIALSVVFFLPISTDVVRSRDLKRILCRRCCCRPSPCLENSENHAEMSRIVETENSCTNSTDSRSV